MAALALAAALALVAFLGARPAQSAEEPGDPARGASVFLSAGCGSCHTVSAVGSVGTVGPPLDGLGTSEGAALDMVTWGSLLMPAYGSLLASDEIRDVAAFVAAVGRNLPIELLPNLDVTRPERIAVVTDVASGRTTAWLRSRAVLENVGPGPLSLVGESAGPDGTLAAGQMIERSDGASRTIDGEATLEAAGQAWRLRAAVTFQLRRVGGRKVVREVVVDTCLADRIRAPHEPSRRLDLPLAPPDPVFASGCPTPELGLSSGWGAPASGSLDLNGLRNGRYLLVIRADPEGALLEASETDNVSSALIELRRPTGAGGALSVRVVKRCSDGEACSP